MLGGVREHSRPHGQGRLPRKSGSPPAGHSLAATRRCPRPRGGSGLGLPKTASSIQYAANQSEQGLDRRGDGDLRPQPAAGRRPAPGRGPSRPAPPAHRLAAAPPGSGPPLRPASPTPTPTAAFWLLSASVPWSRSGGARGSGSRPARSRATASSPSTPRTRGLPSPSHPGRPATPRAPRPRGVPSRVARPGRTRRPAPPPWRPAGRPRPGAPTASTRPDHPAGRPTTSSDTLTPKQLRVGGTGRIAQPLAQTRSYSRCRRAPTTQSGTDSYPPLLIVNDAKPRLHGHGERRVTVGGVGGSQRRYRSFRG
jgi:hypothetical protein